MLDTETTGLDPARHHLTELAVVIVDHIGRLEGEHRWRLDDGVPALARLLLDVAPVVESGVVVAHNLRFDLAFLAANETTRAAELADPARWLCTYRISGGRSLASFADCWGVVPDAPHTAAGDSLTLALALSRLAQAADERGVSTVAGLALATPARRGDPQAPQAEGPTGWVAVREGLDYVVPFASVSREQRDAFAASAETCAGGLVGPEQPAAIEAAITSLKKVNLSALALDLVLGELGLRATSRSAAAVDSRPT